jgi:transglutaminase-like putative cysteine protease
MYMQMNQITDRFTTLAIDLILSIYSETKNLYMYYPRVFFIAILLLFLAACKQDAKQSTSDTQDAVTKGKAVTISDVEEGIRSNISTMTAEGGGFFHFKNDTLELSLKLVRVHTEYLSVLGPNEFFACVDLATEDGDVFDLDFFLKGIPGNMDVTRTTLHKLNGKPFYTWKQAKDKTWFTVPVQQATNDLLGVVEGRDQFDFTYEVVLPEIEEAAEMWIPIPQTDAFQTVEILSLKSPGKYRILEESEFGNSILYIRLLPEHSKGSVAISYRVDRKEKSVYVEPNVVPARYLKEAALLPVGGRFSTIAEEIISESKATSQLTKARAIYDYIIDNMRYAKQGIYGTGDANYACDNRSGNCTEFHSFFISLARSAGIPARFAVGAAIPSARDDGKVDGYHCWAEFYAEDKWWPVDISEGDKYSPLATYYFGHHPANRIELSRGRDLAPDPIPQSGPINFLAYPVLEIGGLRHYPETIFSFRRAGKNS